MSKLIEVRHLTCFYPHKHFWRKRKKKEVILNDISFSLNQGEILCLMGKSGTGKTTLAKTLWGIHPYFDGAIDFKGDFKKDIQGVFQFPHESLDPLQTVGEMLKESAIILGQDCSKEGMIDSLNKVNLESSFLKAYPHELSGGECQRVNLARSLFLKAKLIILDESLRSLDLINQRIILDLILSIKENEEVSFIIITHDKKISDYLNSLLLDLGRESNGDRKSDQYQYN